jgi:hypothetical protein
MRNNRCCAGWDKRGDKVDLIMRVTAEDRTAAAAAAAATDYRFLELWKRPTEEKVCRDCSKCLTAAVLQLKKHLSTFKP